MREEVFEIRFVGRLKSPGHALLQLPECLAETQTKIGEELKSNTR